MQEMGFLVDDRSVIGVSNLVVASDYKDANVPRRQVSPAERRQGGEPVRMNVVEEETWAEWTKGRWE